MQRPPQSVPLLLVGVGYAQKPLVHTWPEPHTVAALAVVQPTMHAPSTQRWPEPVHW